MLGRDLKLMCATISIAYLLDYFLDGAPEPTAPAATGERTVCLLKILVESRLRPLIGGLAVAARALLILWHRLLNDMVVCEIHGYGR